jgi:CRP-like cAMP-binding protein
VKGTPSLPQESRFISIPKDDAGHLMQEQLLRAILATVARQTFSTEFITEKVAIGADKAKQVDAYNLCDGTRSQSEVAKSAGLDQGSFSRTLARWIELGIVIRVGEGRDVKLVHVYPIPPMKKGKNNGS